MAGFTYVASRGGGYGAPATPSPVSKRPFLLLRQGAAAATSQARTNTGDQDHEGVLFFRERGISDNSEDNTRPPLAIRQDDETDPLKFLLSEIGSLWWFIRSGNDAALRPVTDYLGASAAMKFGQLAGAFDAVASAGLDLVDAASVRLGRQVRFQAVNEAGTHQNTDNGYLVWRCKKETLALASGIGSRTSAITFPAGSIGFGVTWKWGQSNGVSSVDCGIGGDLQRFNAAAAVGVGTTARGLSNNGIDKYNAGTPVVFTFDVNTTNANGSIVVALYYWEVSTVS